MRLSGVVALVVVVGALGAGAYYAKQRLAAATAPPPPQYATATVTTGTMVADVLGYGSLNPVYESPLRVSASGQVQTIDVKQGDIVHTGEVLATLTNPQLVQQIATDKSNVQSALQTLANALDVPVSQAMAVSANTSIPVTAPQTGRVEQLSLAVGSSVKQGAIVATIVNDKQVEIDLNLVPYDAAHAQVGDPVQVRFAQFSGSVSGVVSSIATNPVPGSSGFTYPTVVTLQNPGLLVPKMTGTMTITENGAPFPVPGTVTVSGYGQSTTVISPITGTVESLGAQDNAWVTQGQNLMSLGGPAAISAIDQDRQAVTNAQQTLQQAEQQQASLTVTSTLNGTVGFLFLQPGETVNSGALVAQVFNSQSMNLTIQVSELQIASVHTGQSVQVTTPGLPGKVFTGQVSSINTTGTSQNGLATFGVDISVASTSGLRPGMTADARIVIATVNNALLVPVVAVLPDGTGAEVEVLQNGKLEAVPVKVGLVNSTEAQILSGLQAGETVVTGAAGTVPTAVTGTATTGTGTAKGSTGTGKSSTGTGTFGIGPVRHVSPPPLQPGSPAKIITGGARPVAAGVSSVPAHLPVTKAASGGTVRTAGKA